MNRLMKVALVMFVCVIVSALSFSYAQAAPATLTVQIDLTDKSFWDCMYLPKDGDFAKPSVIQVAWDTGDVAKTAKTEKVLLPRSVNGKLAIVTEKGMLVNMRVSIRDAKNNQLGYITMQVVNRGQTEIFTIAPPEVIEPTITYGRIDSSK